MQSVLILQQWVRVVAAIEGSEQQALRNDYQQFPWHEVSGVHDEGSNLMDWVLVVFHNDNSYMLNLSSTDHPSV